MQQTTNAAVQLMAANFDITSFEDVQSASVVIKDPSTGAPTPFVVELAGPEHPFRKKDDFNRARRMRQDLMKSGKVQLADPEEEDAEVTDRLADYTLGWQGLSVAGQMIEFSREAAIKLYSDPKRRWLRDQVKAALEERERFIKRSAAN